jgi:predicted RNase H-like HicB family nuclease
MRAIELYPGEDGYWVAECPSLPGCISQGSTKSEALANVKEAIEGWLETAVAHGQPIPEEPYEIYEELDLGPGGYAVAPSTEIRQGVQDAIRRKLAK